MTFEDIEAIVRRLDGAGIARADITVGTARLTLRFDDDAQPVVPPAPFAGPDWIASPLAAPCPGRFRPRHPLSGAAPIATGDHVVSGDIVGFVEANGVLHPVIATAAVILGPALVDDGAAVGWGTPLYAAL